jgi:uncharacterized protein YraI
MLRALMLAGALIVGVAVPTLADAATVTGIVNIRSGPGMKYAVLRWAWPGVEFTVQRCTRLWCRVTYFGVDGWVSAHWVSGYTAPVAVRVAPAARAPAARAPAARY